MQDSQSKSSDRQRLLESLEARYASGGNAARRTFLRKKFVWLAVVRGTRLLKRAIDVVAAGAGLLMLSPLFLVVALAIRWTDGGPIFYVSERIGRYGRPFQFPKFRSMRVNAHQMRTELREQNQHGDSVTFKMRDDPRVTTIGRIIRKFSIDELPQLWCVLKGEMSLVGPRPPLAEEVARYSVIERRRLDIRPGLTCFWQIGGRGDVPFEQQMRLDLQYIESSSLVTDITILLKTIPAVLLGKGAY